MMDGDARAGDDEVGLVGVDRRATRRAALRAALGGAVVGATFVAPKVKGMSVAPDYAAAMTCTSGSNAFNFNIAGDGSGRRCWDGSTYNCFNQRNNACNNPRTSNFVVAAGTGGNPDLVATVTLNRYMNDICYTGGFPTTAGGDLNVVVNGIQNNTNQNCTVNANMACDGDYDGGTKALTGSGSSISYNYGNFNCDYRIAAQTVNITVACTCV